MALASFVAALLGQLAYATQSSDQATESTPATRILLVDLDDVGHATVKSARTPTLDGLTRTGRHFTTLVTAPTCSPSRAMLNTGARCSHPNVLLGRVIRAKYKGSQAYSLPTEPLVPLAKLVAQSGRRTAKIGKWHLAQDSELAHPGACGWQEYTGVFSNLKVGKSTYTSYTRTAGGKAAPADGPYLTTQETDDAIDAVKRGVDLVSLSYHAPHKPWHRPPATLVSKESQAIPADAPLVETELAALMLEACDRELGRLLEAAETAGYVVFVFGDNGGQDSTREVGGKGTFLDSGIVVPMWAKGPGIQPGVDESIVSMVDFYATVAELFGIERAPATQGPHSISFAGALKGEPGAREWAYAEIFTVLGEDPRKRMNIQWQRAVRGKRFKLFENRGGRHTALFDLDADPFEQRNLLDSKPLAPEALAAFNEYRGILAGI
ncbi:MAG: sulfatase-like hydrolase/transferase [Planctomycetota bacterium]